MAFNQLATIQAAVASRLHKTWSPDLAATPFWPQVVSDALTKATNEINSRLAVRGYTPAQIASWDRAAEFELRLACYFALSEGRGLDAQIQIADAMLSSLDVRDELSGNPAKDVQAVPVIVAGVPQTPLGVGAVELVGTGPFVTTTDEFVFQPCPDREGKPTRW